MIMHELKVRYSFLGYASRHWFDHAEQAEIRNVSQTEFLREINKVHSVKRLAEAHGMFCTNKREIGESYMKATCFDDKIGHKDLLSISLAHKYNIVARILVEHAADIYPLGWDYNSAFYASVCNDDTEMLRLLYEHGADPNGWHGENTPLHIAIQRYEKSTEVVKLLLDYGADVNATKLYRGTPLRQVLGEERVNQRPISVVIELMKLLLDRGADVNASYINASYVYDASNALHDAIQRRMKEVVELLLDRGADINAKGGKYGTALQAAAYAAYRGNTEIVRLLLERSADVNAQGREYGTALQAAATAYFPWGDPRARDDPRDVAKLLLEHGADVNAQGGRYGKALQAAILKRREDIAVLLVDFGADISTLQPAADFIFLSREFERRRDDITKMFPDNGVVTIKSKGKYGSALQMAILQDYPRFATVLIKHGADVNYRTELLGPPLILAIPEDNLKIATVLLEHGADVNGEHGEFGAALQWAVCVSPHNEFVTLLIEHGANVHARGGKYGSALQAARVAGRIDIELLREHGATE